LGTAQHGRGFRWIARFAAPLAFLLGCSGCGDDGDDDAVAGDLDEVVADWLETSGVSSVSVALLRGGRVARAEAYGVADRERDVEATPDTIYLMASCSKPVVGMTAMALVDEGALDLDADIGDYLGFDVRNPHFPEVAITLRLVLAHSASLVDASQQDLETYPRPDPTVPLEQTIREALLPGGAQYQGGAFWSSDAAPGTANKYANFGSALAALVVEKAADRPFQRYSEEVILAPLGLANTRWFYGDLPAPDRVAVPYDEGLEPFGAYGFDDWPSGQLRAPMPEYARLLLALMGRGTLDGVTVLSAGAVAELERVQYPDLDETQALHLFTSEDDAGRPTFWHEGEESGAAAAFVYRPDGVGAVFAANGDIAEDDYDDLTERLMRVADAGD
jgi:CubicO group peptidase (beta-lactamase class C family)